MLKLVLHLAGIIILSASGQKATGYLVPAVEVQVPRVVVAGVGQDAVIRCISPAAVNIQWLINGTSLGSLALRNVVQSFSTFTKQGAVRFCDVPFEFNGTTVQCIVNTTSDVVEAPNSTLLLQGTLSAVEALSSSSIVNSTVFLNWTAPFTLDITLIHPDITYCVDVVSSTSSATLHSECGITETEFTYPLPPRSECDEYNFTVTPVNVVGNGTTVSCLYRQDIPGSFLVDTNIGSADISLVMSAPVCRAELVVVDLHTTENYVLSEIYTVAETNIRFPLELLTSNRQYRVTILASNTAVQATSEGHISTHDITNCTTYNELNSVAITVEFKEHSEATGALLNFIFINEDGVDYSKSISLTVDKTNASQGLILPLKMWYPGKYVLYAYDIENNKKIMNGVQYEASSSNLTVLNGQANSTSPTSITNCSVSSYAGVITVGCSFVFQVTAQLNALDNVSILHVNTSMDPQTPVTLQVKDNGEYLVTVLHILDENGIISSEIQAQMITITTQSPVTNTTSTSSDVTSLNVTGCLEAVVVVTVVVTVVVAVVAAVPVAVLVTIRKKKKKEHMYIDREMGTRTTQDAVPGSHVHRSSLADDVKEIAVEESAESQFQTATSRGFGIGADDDDDDDDMAPLFGFAHSTMRPIIRNFLMSKN